MIRMLCAEDKQKQCCAENFTQILLYSRILLKSVGAQLIVCVDEDKHRLSATEDINHLELCSFLIFCPPKTL